MHLYVTDQNTKLIKTSGQLKVVNSEKKVIFFSPVLYIETVHLFGNIQVTSQTMALLSYNGIPVAFYTVSGKYKYSLTAPLNKFFNLRKRQITLFSDQKAALKIARSTMVHKITNQLAVLERLRRRKGGGITQTETDLKNMMEPINNASDAEELLGLEGSAARKYWRDINRYITPDFPFEKRSRRPPGNEANALISFVYSLLYTVICGLVQGHAYEPFLGFFHKVKNGRYTLALDLMEPYRPVVDRFSFAMLNKSIVNGEDFISKNKGVFLNEKGRKKVITQFYQFIQAERSFLNLKDKNSVIKTIRMTIESLKGQIMGNEDIFYPLLKG